MKPTSRFARLLTASLIWCVALVLPASRCPVADGAPIEREKKDREMKKRLDAIRLGAGFGEERARAARQYAAAFKDYGIDVEDLEPKDAAARLKESAICDALIAALDDWSFLARDAAARKRLQDVVRRVDADPFRTRVREALEKRDRAALAKLATDAGVRDLSQTLLVQFGAGLAHAGAGKEAVALLRQAQRTHPDDFWINFQLGYLLSTARPPRADEAIRFYTAAVALRPSSAETRLNLGRALRLSGKLDEAVASIRKAIELDPKLRGAFTALGDVLTELGKLDEATACYRRALESDPPGDVAPLLGLANVSLLTGKVAEATDLLRQAVKLDPKSAPIHLQLGRALMRAGKAADAIAEIRKAIELKPDYADAYFQLGLVLSATGKPAEAEASLRKAIALRPDHAEAHDALGLVLESEGKLAEAIAAFRQALRLKPDLARTYYNLGVTLKKGGKVKEAAAALKTALEKMSKKDPLHAKAEAALKECEKDDK
jgi:tetratricopeptide (TPR) repeat protein